MADSTPPALTSLTLPSIIDISAGDQSVIFAASVFEAESGVQQVTVWLDHSFQDEIGTFPLVIIFPTFPDDWSDGSASDGRTASRFNAPGTYAVTSVVVRDKANNERTYLPAELSALGFPTSFEIHDAGYKPTPGDDTLTGSGLAETLDAQSGNDIVSGLAGDDRLNGEQGNDALLGGPGKDTLAGGDGNDILVGGIGYDPAEAGTGDDTFRGDTGQDIIFGADGIDLINGGEGNDAALGGAGNDIIRGDAGDDLLMGGSSYDPAETGTGNDSIEGGAGSDLIFGGDGADTISGGADADYILAGSGTDLVTGGDGDDFLFAGGAFAFNQAGSGDTLQGGNGTDFIVGGQGADMLSGDAGDDVIFGGDGADLINTTTNFGDSIPFDAGNGNDSLFGEGGNDRIRGGAGFDYIYGGSGADLFEFHKGDSFDTIWDFNPAEGDRISFGSDIFSVLDGFDYFKSLLTGFSFDGAEYTVIHLPTSGDQLTVKGLAPNQWTPAMVNLWDLGF